MAHGHRARCQIVNGLTRARSFGLRPSPRKAGQIPFAASRAAQVTSVPASGACREKNLNEAGWWVEHPMARSRWPPYGANMTTLLIIVLLLALFGGGGGYYYSRRRR